MNVAVFTNLINPIASGEWIIEGKLQVLRPATRPTNVMLSEVKQEHALNLSISLSAGETENNNDCLSNGE